LTSLEFHVSRGDFEAWVTSALENKQLAKAIKTLRVLNMKGENLRKKLVNTMEATFKQFKYSINQVYTKIINLV
jgi:hypothetical protein